VYLWGRLRVGIEGPRLFLRMKLQKKLNRQTLDDYKGDFGKLAEHEAKLPGDDDEAKRGAVKAHL